MSDCIVGLRLRVVAFIFLFLFIFLSFPILHVNIKKFYVGIVSGTFAARMLNLGIHMDNFKAKCVSQFSPELWKLKSSNMVYICRMSDCIMGLRLRVMAFIFLFFIYFTFFPQTTSKH